MHKFPATKKTLQIMLIFYQTNAVHIYLGHSKYNNFYNTEDKPAARDVDKKRKKMPSVHTF